MKVSFFCSLATDIWKVEETVRGSADKNEADKSSYSHDDLRTVYLRRAAYLRRK